MLIREFTLPVELTGYIEFRQFFREAVIKWCDETVEPLKTIGAK